MVASITTAKTRFVVIIVYSLFVPVDVDDGADGALSLGFSQKKSKKMRHYCYYSAVRIYSPNHSTIYTIMRKISEKRWERIVTVGT